MEPVSHSPTVSISLNLGRSSYRVGTYAVSGGDAMAQADVIDKIVREILARWPNVVYSDQIENFVTKGECQCPNPRP